MKRLTKFVNKLLRIEKPLRGSVESQFANHVRTGVPKQ